MYLLFSAGNQHDSIDPLSTDHVPEVSYVGRRWNCNETRASCQICKIAGCACPGNAGNISPPPRVSAPDMHHGTCVAHVLYPMPGSLTSGSFEVDGEENVPGISGACATRNFTPLVRGPFKTKVMFCK